MEQCISADEVSHDFTLAAVNGDMDKAWEMVGGPLKKNRSLFNQMIARQFRSLKGKKVYHSVRSKLLKNFDCDRVGMTLVFKDHRLLVALEGENMHAVILPMKVNLQLDGMKWAVHEFSSTAF